MELYNVKEYFTKPKINILFNYLFVLYAFIMPINMSKLDGIIGILIILWIVNFNYTKLLTILKHSTLLKSILLLSLLILLSYIWSTDHTTLRSQQKYSDMSYYFYRYIIFFILPIIMIITNLKKEFIPIIINSFIFGMFINELLSYGIFFELWTTPGGTPSNPVPYHSNHITYSTFIGFTILLSAYKFNHIENMKIRLFYIIFMLTMSINLFLSAGRTGQFSLFITSILLILIYFRKNIKMLFFSSLMVIMIFLLAFNNVSTFNKRVIEAQESVIKIYNNQAKDTSLGTRIMAFDTIPYLINSSNILFGEGIGDKPSYVSSTLKNEYPHRLMNFDVHGYLHNSHLEMLVSNGLVGLFLYLSIFYFLFTIKIKDTFIKYISYSLSIYLFCFGMTADIFFWKEPMSLFAFFLGIVILQSQLEKKTIDG